MDITSWANLVAFDIMGEVGIGKDFNNLKSGSEHPAIKAIHEHMTILGIVSLVPWLLYILSCIPGAAAGYTGMFKLCSDQLAEKEKVRL